MGYTKKVDVICMQAIEDLRNIIEKEYEKTYHTKRRVTFVEASKILGIKYYQMNFGKIPMEEVVKFLRSNGFR